MGFLALLWFLVRVIPKPSRAAYPCQRAAFPLASGFVLWLAGLLSSFFVHKRIDKYLKVRLLAQACLFLWMVILFSIYTGQAEGGVQAAMQKTFEPAEGSNVAIGTGKGLHPGEFRRYFA